MRLIDFKAKTPLIGMFMVFLAMGIVAVTAYQRAGRYSAIGYGIVPERAFEIVLNVASLGILSSWATIVICQVQLYRWSPIPRRRVRGPDAEFYRRGR